MPDIQHAILIAAAPEKVYPLVATARGLSEWWAADVSEANGAVELGFFKRATVYRLRLASDQPDRVEWKCETGEEWNGTRIIFLLKATSSGTQLRFSHAGWKDRSDWVN